MTEWHRLFGLVLTDFFTGSPFEIELEKDLSHQQQMLDVIILRKRPGIWNQPLPDGFGELANHTLLSFKSYQEALTAWSLQELIGHYVSYRKLISPSPNNLLPETDFRLMVFCVRYPQQLAAQVPLREVSAGVYDCQGWGLTIRIIVGHQLPKTEQNAFCLLFSAIEDQAQFGAEHYYLRSANTNTLILELFKSKREEVVMPLGEKLLEEFVRDARKRMFAEMTPAQRLEGLRPEEILPLLPPEVIEEYLRKVKGQATGSFPNDSNSTKKREPE